MNNVNIKSPTSAAKTGLLLAEDETIQPLLSIIVPVHDEAEVLPELNERLCTVLDSLTMSSEIVYIDDGSSDNSFEIMQSLPLSKAQKVTIRFSRNFGKEAAMSAGLARSLGQAVILIDSDLQDPPELIPGMLSKWQEGFDIVNMQRATRLGETWLKRLSASLFYTLINKLSDTHIPKNVGDFRLISRRVVDQLNQLPERNLYMKGLLSWPGFDQCTVQFDRDARWGGATKWSYFKLLGLAMDGITAFSTRPLSVATWVGSIVATAAFVYGFWVVVKTLVLGEAVTGYPSLMVVILALGGVQMLSIGLIGSYLGRVFTEVKKRPTYIIQEVKTYQNESADGVGHDTHSDAN